jgi:hypothetical protein
LTDLLTQLCQGRQALIDHASGPVDAIQRVIDLLEQHSGDIGCDGVRPGRLPTQAELRQLFDAPSQLGGAVGEQIAPGFQEAGVAAPVSSHAHDGRERRSIIEASFVPLGAFSDFVSELGQGSLDLLDAGVLLGALLHRGQERSHGLRLPGDLSHRDGRWLRGLAGRRFSRRDRRHLSRCCGGDQGQSQAFQQDGRASGAS